VGKDVLFAEPYKNCWYRQGVSLRKKNFMERSYQNKEEEGSKKSSTRLHMNARKALRRGKKFGGRSRNGS